MVGQAYSGPSFRSCVTRLEMLGPSIRALTHGDSSSVAFESAAMRYEIPIAGRDRSEDVSAVNIEAKSS